MNISRKQSFLFAGLILLIFISTTYFFSKRNSSKSLEKSNQTAATNTELKPLDLPPSDGSTQFALGDFHRSESKDGKLLWEVSAKQGVYHPTTHTADVVNPLVTLFRDNGVKIDIVCEKASLLLDGVSLNKAELIDNVLVTYNNPAITMRSSHAIFDKEQGVITSPSPVVISSELIDVTGDTLVAYVDTYTVKVNDNVKTVIRPSSKRNKL